MRLTASSVIMSCLHVALSSAWHSRDTNRACDYGGDPDHTMCTTSPAAEKGEKDGMPVWEGADKCDIKLRGIDKVGQKSILDHLNKRRNEVAGGQVKGQPEAANMKKLVWNEELATIAQRWTDQCHYDETKHDVHDTGHRGTSDGESTGQNGYIGEFERQLNTDYGEYDYRLEEDSDRASDGTVYVSWATNNIMEMNDKTRAAFMEGIGRWTEPWFSEVLKFTSKPDEPYAFVYNTGHYTQEVWAESGDVGCGWNFITVDLNEEWEKYVSLMFCNFLPGGNVIGAPSIYEIGEGASNCPAGFSKDAEYPNLCSK